MNIDDRPEVNKYFYFPRFGYSDRLTELEAALGLGELDGWQSMIEQRQQNAAYLMSGIGEYAFYPVEDITRHSFMFFPMLVGRRDELMLYLEQKGIQTRTMMPLTTQPVIKPYVKKKYPGADFINDHGILVGCHQYLTNKDLDEIINAVKGFYA